MNVNSDLTYLFTELNCRTDGHTYGLTDERIGGHRDRPLTFWTLNSCPAFFLQEEKKNLWHALFFFDSFILTRTTVWVVVEHPNTCTIYSQDSWMKSSLWPVDAKKRLKYDGDCWTILRLQKLFNLNFSLFRRFYCSEKSIWPVLVSSSGKRF